MEIFDFSGKSMQPTLCEGMRIGVERVRPEEVRPGAIILYETGRLFACHRVIKVLRGKGGLVFVTKGDNHAYINSADIPQSDLRGVVISAFKDSDPGDNLLTKNIFISRLYVIIGNWSLYCRNNRQRIPGFIRAIFKPLVGGFFLIFKKTIHLIYLRTRHERMFFGR